MNQRKVDTIFEKLFGPPKVDVANTVFEKLFGTPEYAEEIDPENTQGQVFTLMVDALRSADEFPVKVKELAELLWDLVGNRITPVACGPEVVAMHFYVEIPANRKPIACIFCPHNWSEMVKENPILQFGALTFIGSQARDFYNNRITDGHLIVRKRSWAYESEYLHRIMELKPFKADQYQQTVMREFPKGLASLDPNLWYESKPFEKPYEKTQN